MLIFVLWKRFCYKLKKFISSTSDSLLPLINYTFYWFKAHTVWNSYLFEHDNYKTAVIKKEIHVSPNLSNCKSCLIKDISKKVIKNISNINN